MTTQNPSLPVAVVTGATGGMGREIVADLARDHHVYALGRNPERLSELARLDNVTTVNVDLVAAAPTGDFGLPAQMQSAGNAQEPSAVMPVEVVVHAAAIARKHSVSDATWENWREHMDLNVFVPSLLTRALLPSLRAAGGTAVFINSGAGRGGYGDNVVYAASKHALYALADALRKAEHDIRVTTVAPGPTDTEMLRGLIDYNPEHVIAPVEVACAVRAAIDAGPTTQLTEIQVRPRIELADRT